MKKNILAFLLSAALLLCSGCNNTEQNSELDDLISSLPTIHLGGEEDPEEAKPSYKSVTGTVSAVAKKNITVKTDEKDYKFATDKDPQIFGGTIEKGLTVTVTYESSQDEGKTITPKTITILDGNPDTTVSAEETALNPEEISQTDGSAAETDTLTDEASQTADSSAEGGSQTADSTSGALTEESTAVQSSEAAQSTESSAANTTPQESATATT